MGNSGNDRRIDNIEFTVSDIARSREFYGKEGRRSHWRNNTRPRLCARETA